MEGTDITVPENIEVNEDLRQPTDIGTVNLAKDEALCKKVRTHIQYFFDKYKSNRTELEDIWKTADWMFKCGQEETLRESERTRTDRDGDNLTKTKSKALGSTLFYRQVKTIAALFVSVVNSQKDPYTFKARYNPEVFFGDKQADELANMHNLLMRWSRDQEGFRKKFIDFCWTLVREGNVPIYANWLRRSADVLDRWPVKGSDGTVQSTVIERRRVIVDNRFEVNTILNENFYIDQSIVNIKDQQCIIVKSLATLGNLINAVEREEYINFDKIDESMVWTGGSDDDVRSQRQLNEGYNSEISESQTGAFLQFDAHVLLPINDKGKWDDKVAPSIYWVTIVSNNGNIDDGVCVRLERNRDPMDDMPFEMIKLIPDDAGKAYGLSLCQVLRSNYTEETTTRQQLIDAKTANNNRPLKIIGGEVHVDGTDDLAFAPDKVYVLDSQNSMGEFLLAPIPDNTAVLSYLQNDSNAAAGTDRIMTGQPMGSRTSSNEAQKAFEAASLPHKMMMIYVFEQYFGFRAKKGTRYWHLYAQEDQILKITDDEKVYQNIKPIDLFGDFDIELSIVDEYEKDLLTKSNYLFAAQNIIPLFQSVVDMKELSKVVFRKVLNIDVSPFLIPDKKDESLWRAKKENSILVSGEYIPPSIDEDFDVMLAEHKGERMLYTGIEAENVAAVRNLDRHILETEFLKEQQAAVRTPLGQAAQPPQNATDGQVAGNEIAAALGALR